MGPLKGVKCLEVGGIGPAPFCGMMLSDMGAEVIRIDRKGLLPSLDPKYDIMLRGRQTMISLDLKSQEGIQALLDIVDRSDVLFEGFRPGVMEKLGLGPDVCLERNPKLVYGRVTGWGQEGPLSQKAGHDINYVALMGVLHAIGHSGEKPVVPLNLVGDWAGGGMLLAFGILAALLESRQSGVGQVVDAAMVDGVAMMLATTYGLLSAGLWKDERENNLLDGGAHFYTTYETADGKYVAFGAVEPKFYKTFLTNIGLDPEEFKPAMDRKRWPEHKKRIAKVIKTKTRDQWCEIFEENDACFAPILSLNESFEHPHNKTRNSFVEIEGVKQQIPAPRFSRSTPEVKGLPPAEFEHTASVLKDWGFDNTEIERFKSQATN